MQPSTIVRYEPLHYSQHPSPSQPQTDEEAKSAAIADIAAKLAKLRQKISYPEAASCANTSPTAQYRKEHELLLRRMMDIDGQSGASKEFNELQSQADSEAMTHPSFLHRLTTLSEVEPILAFFNARRRWLAANGKQRELLQVASYHDRVRSYRQKIDIRKKQSHRRPLQITASTRSVMEWERGMDPDTQERVVSTKSAVSIKENCDPHKGPQNTTECMADLVTEISKITRKVNDVQRSISSGEKGGTTVGLGLALLVTVQELLDRTMSLVGKPAKDLAAEKAIQVKQGSRTEGYASPQYIESWESDSGDIGTKDH